MLIQKKAIRYYYWLIKEFIKKHIRIILLSFFTSFIAIIFFISFSPYIETFFFTQKDVIGLIGSYDIHTLPETITSKISSGLIFINEKGEIAPAISSSWEMVDKEKEYRFHIRDNLIWSDGSKFSARDINYQFKDIRTEIIDEKTIRFILQKPLPIFPNYLRKPIIKYPLIGVAGIYKVDKVRYRYDVIAELSLSPNKKGLPLVVYKFFMNESQVISAYKRGEINQMLIHKKSIADIFSNWKNTTISKDVDYSLLLTLFFNFKNDILKEKEIRQAIDMSVNKSTFADFGQLAVGPIPPISWAFNENVTNTVIDAEAAKKIIQKSFSASDSAELSLSTYYDHLGYAEELVKNLEEIGFKVNVNLLSADKPSEFDLFLAFLDIGPDPDQYFFWHSTQSQGNISGYKNVKIDKLLEDGRNTLSIAERKKTYYEFQRIMQDDPPAIFLFYPYLYTIRRR